MTIFQPAMLVYQRVHLVDLLVNVGKYTVRPMDASFVFGKLAFPRFCFFHFSRRLNGPTTKVGTIETYQGCHLSGGPFEPIFGGACDVFRFTFCWRGVLNRKHLDLVCLRALNMMGFIHLFFCPFFENCFHLSLLDVYYVFSCKFQWENVDLTTRYSQGGMSYPRNMGVGVSTN